MAALLSALVVKCLTALALAAIDTTPDLQLQCFAGRCFTADPRRAEPSSYRSLSVRSPAKIPGRSPKTYARPQLASSRSPVMRPFIQRLSARK
jgi:hypothetical protein